MRDDQLQHRPGGGHALQADHPRIGEGRNHASQRLDLNNLTPFSRQDPTRLITGAMVDFSWQGRAALGSLLDIQGVNYQYLLVKHFS